MKEENNMKLIDLRSDTVTKPSAPMLEAMVKAEVGDDVFGEDPTVNRLQRRVAEMFEKEDALFVPSGTMGNEICIKAQTRPGDEIIVEEDSHIFVYESAAPSALSGVQMKPLRGESGMLTASQVKSAIRPSAYYLPRTRLICLENTHGRSGGSVLPLNEIVAVRQLALERGIGMHLDGARIWNACVESNIRPSVYALNFDSLSVCFSKGLGAPIGSMILGSREMIGEARRYRKMWGGGMRQVGIIAAAALYALDHNVDRLREDHAKARALALALSQLPSLNVSEHDVRTNMVIIETAHSGKSQSEALELLRSHGVLLTPERTSAIRAVTHLDVSHADVERAGEIIRSLFS